MPTRLVRLRPLGVALALSLGVLALPLAASPQRLTVYSDGFDALLQTQGSTTRAGYARVQRPLSLRAGEHTIDDLPLAIDPTSVRLLGEGVQVRSQRFDFAGLDQARLLQRALGREITVEQSHAGGTRSFTGELVAVGAGLTLREASGVLRVLSHFSGFTLAQAPEGLVARPTLRFLIDAQGQRSATLDYATAGLAWRAEYHAELRNEAHDCTMRLESHAMAVNRSGIDFRGIAIHLVAGDSNRQIDAMTLSGTLDRSVVKQAPLMVADAAPALTASGNDHRYILPGTGDLPDGSLQRLALLDAAPAVPCVRRFVARHESGDWMPEHPLIQRHLGGDGEVAVRTHLSFQNERSAGLGIPLPAGRLRAFVDDELLGEAELGHTAAGRRVDLDLGRPFDVSSERRTVDFVLDRSGRTMTEAVQWTLRNGKSTPAKIDVQDRLPRWTDWQLVEGAAIFAKKDAQHIEASVTVPAGGEIKLHYTVRYRWADHIEIE